MEGADEFAALPDVHAAVLRLHADGHGDEAIAASLGVEVQAVRPLIRIAGAKLRRLGAAAQPEDE